MPVASGWWVAVSPALLVHSVSVTWPNAGATSAIAAIDAPTNQEGSGIAIPPRLA